MIHVFYFFIIFAILWELSVVVNPKKTSDFIKSIKATEKDNLTDKQDMFVAIHILYLIWVLFGVFTSQWIVFLLLLFFHFIIPNKYYITNFIGGLLSLIILLFLIINQYHLDMEIELIFKK